MNKYEIRKTLMMVLESMMITNKAIEGLMMAARNNSTRLARVEHLLQQVLRADQKIEDDFMAKRETDAAIIAEISRNTSVVQGATAALTHYAETTAELTQKLADAIAGATSTDDEEVAAALAALKANNDSLKAATPEVAAAIEANTEPQA